MQNHRDRSDFFSGYPTYCKQQMGRELGDLRWLVGVSQNGFRDDWFPSKLFNTLRLHKLSTNASTKFSFTTYPNISFLLRLEQCRELAAICLATQSVESPGRCTIKSPEYRFACIKFIGFVVNSFCVLFFLLSTKKRWAIFTSNFAFAFLSKYSEKHFFTLKTKAKEGGKIWQLFLRPLLPSRALSYTNSDMSFVFGFIWGEWDGLKDRSEKTTLAYVKSRQGQSAIHNELALFSLFFRWLKYLSKQNESSTRQILSSFETRGSSSRRSTI